MSIARRFASGLLGALILVFPALASANAVPTGSEAARPNRVLQAIAAWLQERGEEGAMGSDVADVLGIPRRPAENRFDARQLAYRSGETLHLAQVLAGRHSDHLLFMVQRGEEIVFYLSTPSKGLRKAVLSVPGRQLVIPLYGLEAEAGFREAVGYWRAILDRP